MRSFLTTLVKDGWALVSTAARHLFSSSVVLVFESQDIHFRRSGESARQAECSSGVEVMLWQYADLLVTSTTRILAMKGKEEMPELAAGFKQVNSHDLEVAWLNEERRLIEIKFS